ncbi:hypothetical protein JW930_03490 [Candidatus Woesearchaeota archaeon]|nr:hypothetical protein [Candidatus Woesearchaeota archaeon]
MEKERCFWERATNLEERLVSIREESDMAAMQLCDGKPTLEEIQVVKGLQMEQILDSEILDFYEKLYFIQNICSEENWEVQVKSLLDRLSPGELIFELMKLDVVRVGREMHRDLDFSIAFNDPRFKLYEVYLLGDLSNSVFWQKVNHLAEETMMQRYQEGLAQFNFLLRNLHQRTVPILVGKPLVAAVTRDELDYVAAVTDLMHSNRTKSGFDRFDKRLKEQLHEARSAIIAESQSKSKTRIPQYLMKLRERTVTALVLDFPGNTGKGEMERERPIYVAARAKTLRSARAKWAIAALTFLGFYSPGRYDVLLRQMPYVAKTILEESLKKTTSVRFQHEQALLRFKGEYEKYKGLGTWDALRKEGSDLSIAHLTALWNILPQSLRSRIIERINRSSELLPKEVLESVGKWNIKQDLINVVNDWFGITFIYNQRGQQLVHASDKLIASFLDNPIIAFNRGIEAELIEKATGYSATHFQLQVRGSPRTSFGVDAHVMDSEKFAGQFCFGSYAHYLYHTQRRARILEWVGEEDYLNQFEERLGLQTAEKGLIVCLKRIFPEYQEMIRRLYHKGERGYGGRPRTEDEDDASVLERIFGGKHPPDWFPPSKFRRGEIIESLSPGSPSRYFFIGYTPTADGAGAMYGLTPLQFNTDGSIKQEIIYVDPAKVEDPARYRRVRNTSINGANFYELPPASVGNRCPELLRYCDKTKT